MKFTAMRALAVLGLCQVLAAHAAQEPSAWDKTRDGTVHAAKKTNAWIAHAAKKTDRWMDNAVDKVKGAAQETPRQPPARPGPR
jgi:hypothetical protein